MRYSKRGVWTMRETMCRSEYVAFCDIQKRHTQLKKDRKANKITREEFNEGLDKLREELDALEAKYNKIYAKEEEKKKGKTKLL